MHSLFLFFNFSILLVFDRFCLEGHQHNVSGNQQRQLVIAPSILSRFKSLLSPQSPHLKKHLRSHPQIYTPTFSGDTSHLHTSSRRLSSQVSPPAGFGRSGGVPQGSIVPLLLFLGRGDGRVIVVQSLLTNHLCRPDKRDDGLRSHRLLSVCQCQLGICGIPG